MLNRDSYRNFGLGQVHAGGGGEVLCDIPPQKKKAYLSIERPDQSAVNFDEVLDIFTGNSDCRVYSCVRIIIMNFLLWGFLGWEI